MIRLTNLVRLWLHAWGDARTPGKARMLPIVSLLYLFFPVDLVPDILPFIGQTDDVLMILVLCFLAWRAIPRDVKRDFRAGVIDVRPKR